jgi:membrane associated rhomboid family serine protease
MWRSGGVTMLTAFFVHGGWLHLVGNLWFLVVFGDNVEEFLGRARWLLLLGSATVAGMLLHAFGDARSAVPVVGASGGISGLIAFYALRFPRARLGFLLIVRFVPIWLTLPAWGGFALWMLMQVLFLIEQLSGFGRVSALGHLGGVLAGVVAFLVARKR